MIIVLAEFQTWIDVLNGGLLLCLYLLRVDCDEYSNSNSQASMETSTEAEARRSEQREAYLKNLGATKDELQSLVTQAEVELEKLNRV